MRLSTTLLGVAALVLACATQARGSDALDAYRALDRAARTRVLDYARREIALACAPAVAADTAATDSTVLDWPGAPCGVYLSLASGRSTRACVGSLTPLGGTLGETLRELARRVVGDDPRHPPVRAEEIDSLAVLVSFAGPPQAIADPMSVSPGREGLLIASARGSVAFLPGEARTVSWALSEARRIGVLATPSEASYEKFSVLVLRDSPASRSR